jgi:hypothetical protein
MTPNPTFVSRLDNDARIVDRIPSSVYIPTDLESTEEDDDSFFSVEQESKRTIRSNISSAEFSRLGLYRSWEHKDLESYIDPSHFQAYTNQGFGSKTSTYQPNVTISVCSSESNSKNIVKIVLAMGTEWMKDVGQLNVKRKHAAGLVTVVSGRLATRWIM